MTESDAPEARASARARQRGETRRRRVEAVGLGLLLLTGCAKAVPVESSRPDLAPRPLSVIVVPFDASSLTPDDRWMGEGVAQLISLGLVQHPTIVQVERSRVTTVSDPETWSEAMVNQVARELHVDAALYGRLGERTRSSFSSRFC